MRRFYKTVVLAIVLMNISLPSAAAASSFDSEIQAKSFSKLWVETCTSHVGLPKAKELIVMLNSDKRFRKNPDYAQEILGGKKGTVWDASDPKFNIVQAITIYDAEKFLGLRCQVHIRKVGTQSARSYFDKLMPKFVSVGTEVTPSEDEATIYGVKYKKKTFKFHRKGNVFDPYFKLETSESPDAPWQAIMSQSID